MGHIKSPINTGLNAEISLSDDPNISLNTMTQRRMEAMQQFDGDQSHECDRIVHEARFYMARSVEAMLEAGKRLIILKENEPHRDLVGIVEGQLGPHVRAV